MSPRELQKPDTALWIRERAIERFPGWGVDRTEPRGRVMERTTPLLLIYSQDQSRATEWTWNEVIGYRIFAGTRDDTTDADTAAAAVEAWLWTLPGLRGLNPVAAVYASNGPNLVPDEHETAVLYGTVELVIAGVFAPAKAG